MASFETQFENLVKTWELDVSDVKLVTRLLSFHDVQRQIYQRKDTLQYVYIETENSYKDGVDDYFKWNYISDEQAKKCIDFMENLYKK